MLQLEQNEQLQRWTWRLQRVGWVLTGLILIGALAGLMGNGPLADAEARTDGLRVRYSRFERVGVDFSLEIELDASAEPAFWLSQSYAGHMRLVSITPDAASMTADPDRLTFRFHSQGAPARIILHLQANHKRPGIRHARMGRPGASELEFRQFFYP